MDFGLPELFVSAAPQTSSGNLERRLDVLERKRGHEFIGSNELAFEITDHSAAIRNPNEFVPSPAEFTLALNLLGHVSFGLEVSVTLGVTNKIIRLITQTLHFETQAFFFGLGIQMDVINPRPN